MQVRERLLLVVTELGSSNDGITRHDLAVLLDQTDNVRVVKTKHAGLGILQTDGALEFIPHLTPETSTVELARVDGLEAKLLLQLDHVLNGLLLNGGEASLFLRNTLLADGLAGIKEVLGTQKRAHMLGAERRRSHV